MRRLLNNETLLSTSGEMAHGRYRGKALPSPWCTSQWLAQDHGNAPASPKLRQYSTNFSLRKCLVFYIWFIIFIFIIYNPYILLCSMMQQIIFVTSVTFSKHSYHQFSDALLSPQTLAETITPMETLLLDSTRAKPFRKGGLLVRLPAPQECATKLQYQTDGPVMDIWYACLLICKKVYNLCGVIGFQIVCTNYCRRIGE